MHDDFDATNDDFELEISDLEPEEAQGVINHAPTVHFSRKRRAWRTVSVAITLLLVLVLLFNSLPNASSLRNRVFSLLARPTPTSTSVVTTEVVVSSIRFSGEETSSSTSVFVSASGITVVGDSSTTGSSMWADSPPLVDEKATLGPAPSACPFSPPPQNFDASTSFTPGVGGPPIWLTGFTGMHPALTHLVRARQPQFGWYQRIQLVLESNYLGPVSVVGGNLGNGDPLWFGDFATGWSPRKTVLTLHPENPSVSNHFDADEQWISWPATLYIPVAGCYYLAASWGQQHWVVIFSAGDPLGLQPGMDYARNWNR